MLRLIKQKLSDIRDRIRKIFMSGDLINNITVNWLLAPVYFIIIYYTITTMYPSVPLYGKHVPFYGVLPLCLLSTWFYCYSSTFFQPDLDGEWRPGQKGFPLGKWVFKYPWGNTLMIVLHPINRLWFYFWHLYAVLLTHRGISHWPVIGVWTRVGYIWSHVLLARYLMGYFGYYQADLDYFLFVVEKWCSSFFPWNEEFGTAGFYLFSLPVYLSDIAHASVDFFESRAKGKPFVPTLAKRGVLYKLIVDRKRTIGGFFDYLRKF